MIRVLLPLAEGAEEMETTIIVDTLRRAGWTVDVAGLKSRTETVKMSRGIKIEPDIAWDQVNIFDYALMVMPGGIGGKDTLCADERVLEAIRFFASEEDKWLAAVCAAPLVLQEAGVLNGQRITCYPGLSDQVAEAEWVNEPVVSDGHLVTSQGPGTCFLFALRLIELMDGPERAETVASGMLVRP